MVSKSVSSLRVVGLQALVGVSLLVNGLQAENNTARQEFLMCDQPVVVFKALAGSKPQLMKFNPATSDVQTIQFGSYRNGKVQAVKEGADLATMIPLRSTIKNIDNNVKVDKKFAGCRETLVSTNLEKLFKKTGLMATGGYKGIPLVDEYRAGLPMKIVVSTQAHLDGVAEYLNNCFAAKNILPSSKKPLMLVNVVEGIDQEAAAQSLNTLNAYFEVVDAQDPAVKEFFEDAQKAIHGALSKTKDAVNVGESVGERIMRAFEDGVGGYDKENKELDAKKLAMFLVLASGGFIVKDYLLKPACDALKACLLTEDQIGVIKVKYPDMDYIVSTLAVAGLASAGALGCFYYLNRAAQADTTELDVIYNPAPVAIVSETTEPNVITDTAVVNPETVVNTSSDVVEVVAVDGQVAVN